MIKRFLLSALCLFLLFGGIACKEEPLIGGDPLSRDHASCTLLTDALGNEAYVASDARVVACHASFADCWLLSGGILVGVTEDAADYGISTAGLSTVGTAHAIDEERLYALAPDYVILSADVTAHVTLAETLKAVGIPYGLFRVDTFADYKALMTQFCAVSGRGDLYKANVLDVETRIEAVCAQIPARTDKSVLLMRASSSGVKAKREDNLAGMILKELGLRNIADDVPSLMEELSIEQIIIADPDYIFVLTMGSEAKAKAYLASNIENDPAWQGLTAVKNGTYRILPKELFHYKPNERWDESYAYLFDIIFS